MAFTHCPTILMVRKLPADLSHDEACDLLQYFGAKSVSVMSSKGHMRGTAFAEFGSREEADIAMKKLHQAPLFGSRLVVQYSDKNFMPFDAPDTVILPTPSNPTKKTEEESKSDPKPGRSPDPSLHYLYPPPTSQTLSNISHALVAVPQFYIQVLHLMNKMNLPPPFSKSTEKSIFEASESLPPPLPSSSESELESDPEEPHEVDESKKLEIEKEIFKEKRIATQAFLEKHLPESDKKRKRELSDPCPVNEQAKIAKVSSLDKIDTRTSPDTETVDMDLSDGESTNLSSISLSIQPIAPSTPSSASLQVPDILSEKDQKNSSKSKSKEPNKNLKLSDQFNPSLEPVKDKSSNHKSVDLESDSSLKLTAEKPSSSLNPANKVQANSSAQHPSETCLIKQNVVLSESEMAVKSRKEKFLKHQTCVRLKRLTHDKFAEHSVFKKYSKGEPSTKLYIKNLNHKQVQETDLKDLFMPYFEFYNQGGQDKVNEFQIKLMTRGQMKGQAFINLPSIEASEIALSDLHGYVLHGKPMAIMFAKSK